MLKRFFTLFLILSSLLLSASDDTVRLAKAQKALQSSDEIEQFRGYNECKSLYLKALSTKNSPMLKESLEGIIKGGELLAIDVSRYKADLAKLSPEPKAINPKSSTVAATEVTNKPVDRKILEFPREYLKPSVDSTIAPMQPTLPVAVVKNVETAKFSSVVAITKVHRLLDAQWKEKGIELTFDTPVEAKEIRFSKIIEAEKQRFRYIVDIDSARIVQGKSLEHHSLQKIRLAQYDSKTLRVVIESANAIGIKPTYKGKALYLDLELSQGREATTPTFVPLVKAPIAQEPPITVLPPSLVGINPKDKSKKIIVIDPGHGGKDSGAVGNGHMEKEIVLQISLSLAQRLRSLGYTVHLTRDSDFFVELKDRTRFANDKMADLFLSIHANSIAKGSDVNAAYGIETYFLSPGRSERAMRVAAKENHEDMGEMSSYGKLSFLNVLNSEKIIASNKLAIDIQKGVLGGLRPHYPNVKDNGAREAPFWVLVGAQMPAILLETGYISNPEESNRIADPAYQKEMIDGIVDGVKRYFANNQ